VADITQTVSDTISFSGVPDPSGMVSNLLGETISPSGISPSGTMETLNDTISVSEAVPSGISEQLVDSISVLPPSGYANNLIQFFEEEPIIICCASGQVEAGDSEKFVETISLFNDASGYKQQGDNPSVYDIVDIGPLPLPSGSFSIGLPSPGQQFHHGDEITFSGNGSDALGVITVPSVVWYSSIDGIIGRSLFFKSDDLSVGSHTIKVSSLNQGMFFEEIQIEVLESFIAPRVEDIT
jgi:hypothetical protein